MKTKKMLIVTLLVACLSLSLSGCAKLGDLGGLLGDGGSDAEITLSASNMEAIGAAIKQVMEFIDAKKAPQVVIPDPIVIPTPEVPPVIAQPDPVIPPEVTFSYEEHGTVGCGNPPGAQCRELFRFDHPGSYYGKNPQVSFDGVLSPLKVADGAVRAELSSGELWKPLGDSANPKTGTKTLAIHGKYGKKISKCSVKFSRP